MVGHEIIPNIVEKIGDIDWAEFLKRLVGAKPEGVLPVADEVAADGAGSDGQRSSAEKEWAEYDAASEALDNKGSELFALIQDPPADYERADVWIHYLDKLISTEKELISAFDARIQESLDLKDYGLVSPGYAGDDGARIDELHRSIEELERIKRGFSQLDASSNTSFFGEAAWKLEVQLELERLPQRLVHPQPRIASAGG